ncbi:hypothetical protein AB0O34_06675 [Sphaerisporangium sp. NPDC088356]|uniref:hypothetical protein n=1 Tax=Sphaerisporangium sp. NPDC088356 TaxID=3154871 RepID=UPI0034378057
MAPEHTSQPTRPPAWPENPPAWPEMPPPPPPPPPASASVFDPLPYGGRATSDPQSSWEATQQYAPLTSREASQQAPVQTSFPPPPPPSESPFAPPAGPQRYAPQPSGPQQYAPQSTGPQQYTPQPTGPQPTGPQPYAPPSTGPQPYAPPATGPQPYAPPATGPQQFPQQGAARQQYAPEAPPQPFRLPDDAPPAPAYVPAGTEATIRVSGSMSQMSQMGQTGPAGTTAAPEQREQRGQRHAASPQEHDPYKPFVTAGQISGPKTPPPERQQELWNTVFGENYEAMGEEPDDTGGGRRVWLFALIASVAVALVAALLWAFLAGPLRSSADGAEAGTQGSGKSTPKASSSSSGKQATTKPQSIGRLPRYSGEASPRAGILTDKASAISVARLGGPWRLDLRSQHVQTTYGFMTRQYVAAGSDAAGTPQFAQVMTGPLAKSLATKYSADKPEDLTPVISSVAFAARNKFFPAGNKVAKTAEQRLAVGGRPARVVAYQILSGGAKTTLVVGAVSTGADLPVIVYMSVPDSKKELLPDINTVFASIRPTTPAS